MRPKSIVPFVSVALALGVVVAVPPASAVPTEVGDVTLSPAVGPPAGGDPVQITVPGAAWASVSGGRRHTLGVAGDGSLYAWGENTSGQLGTGSTTPSATPVRVDVPLPEGATIQQVSAGDDFSVLLASDGTVWTWGANDRGQLGLGTTEAATTPQQVPGLAEVRMVAAGAQFAAAVIGWESRIATWGANDVGQLGDGSTTDRAVPVVLDPRFPEVEQLTAGSRHVLVRESFYVIHGWGANDYGQLAADVGPYSALPVVVFAGSGCCSGAQLAFAVGDSSFVETSNLELVAFGRNDHGQLGIGTTSRSEPPTPVAGFHPQQVDGGSRHVVGWTEDGRVWTWGDDTQGQLGRGPAGTTRSTRPVEVPDVERGALVAAGEASVTVVDAGYARAWGDNSAGQLGDGTTTNRSTPTEVRAPVEVAGVVVGGQPAGAPVRTGAATWTVTSPALAAGTYDVVVATRDAAGAAGPELLLPGAWRATTAAPPVVVTRTLPDAVVGEPYSATLEARSPTPVTWSAQRLPDGLRLDAATGAVTGRPVQQTEPYENALVTFLATNAHGTTERVIRLFVGSAPVLPEVELPVAAAGRPYSATIPFAGGVTVTAGTLPDGLVLRPGPGGVEIVGTPTTPGGYEFTLTSDNPVAPSSRVYLISVGVSPLFDSEPPPSGQVGVPYTHTFTYQRYGPDRLFLAAGSLPPGLTLDPATGQLTGTPTTAGRFDVVLAARNAWAQEVTDVVIRIVGPGLSAPVTPAVGGENGATAVRVATPSPRFVEIATTGTATLGLTADGYVWAWGDGTAPLLTERGPDVDPTQPRRLALPLEPGLKVTQLVPGSASLVVTSDSTVRQVVVDADGIPSTVTVFVPPVAGTRVRDAVAGDLHGRPGHVLVLTTDGAVWAWGSNVEHQLGDGTTTDRTAPARVAFPAGTVVTSVSAGGTASLASDSAGRVWAWGTDPVLCEDWVGCGSRPVPTRVDLPAGVVATSVATSTSVAAAVTREGALWTWGRSSWYGQKGHDEQYGRPDLLAPAGVTVRQVALTREGGVALLTDGTVRRWGRYACHESLGTESCGRFDDDGFYERTPVRVPAPVDGRATGVTACVQCGLVLTADGSVWGWGANRSGQLGDGTRARRPDPVTALTPFRVTGVAFGGAPGRITGFPANATVSVLTPRHAAGLVDVVVTTERADGTPGPSVRYSGAYTYGWGVTSGPAGTMRPM